MSRAGKTAARIRLDGDTTAAVHATTALRAARRVLVTGLEHASPAVVTAACDVAEAVDAAIDTGRPGLASPLGPVVIRAGAVTADPEELRDRADLVIAWFCDPEADRPGFREAFLGPPLPGGGSRQVLSVGPKPFATASRHLPLSPASAIDAARLLHLLLLGHAPAADHATAAAVTDVCQDLATAIGSSTCVGFMTARAADPLGLGNWAASLLVRAIAHQRPAFEVPLTQSGRSRRGQPTVADILTWRYGASGGIARADRLGAAFRPAECTAELLIARGEVDAVLAVGRLPETVEAALDSRTADLAVVRIDADDATTASLTALLRAVREHGGPGASP